MKHLELFESWADLDSRRDEVADILKNLIHGTEIRDYDIDTIEDYYNYDIPAELKYVGSAYRCVFFETMEQYDNCLKNGLPNTHRVYFSATKDEACIPGIVQSLGTGYEYYIVFEIPSTLENCIFDVNEMCENLGVDSTYGHEQEVLIYSDKVPQLMPTDINEHGLIEDYY